MHLEKEIYAEKIAAINRYDRATPQRFAPALSPSRLNRLFRVLQSKEKEYGSILSELGVVSFEQLVKDKLSFPASQAATSQFAVYRNEVKSFLRINSSSQTLLVSNEFVDYLRHISDLYSFHSTLENMTHEPFRKVIRPLII